MTDVQLVDKYVRNENWPIGIFIKNYWEILFSISNNILKDNSSASDVIQEVAIKLILTPIEKRAKVFKHKDGKTDVKRTLVKRVHDKAINEWRIRKRSKVILKNII